MTNLHHTVHAGMHGKPSRASPRLMLIPTEYRTCLDSARLAVAAHATPRHFVLYASFSLALSFLC